MSSSTIDIAPEQKPGKQLLPWSLWLRQIRAIFRLEIEKNFLGRRSILLYLLALLPVLPLALLAPFTPPGREWHDFNQYNMIFAIYYGGLILRTVVFFGCAWIFMNLFRGDLIDRSLHFYFLSPVRREMLVVGKYLSDWLRRSFFSQRRPSFRCCCSIYRISIPRVRATSWMGRVSANCSRMPVSLCLLVSVMEPSFSWSASSSAIRLFPRSC